MLIAIDPPTMLLAMFTTYALSAPVMWLAARVRRLFRGAPSARSSLMDERRHQYLQAIGVDVWVRAPQAAARGRRSRARRSR